VKTVGRNANLLLNISPNTDGTIDAVDMLAYRQLGAWVAQSFGRQVRGPA
jgi:alpha-L-fucosidase